MKINILILILFSFFAFPGTASAQTYRQVAENMVQNLPEGTRVREDLEAVIGAEASSYRQSKKRAS